MASTQPLAQASVLAAPSNADRVSLCLPGSESLSCMCVSVAGWPAPMCASRARLCNEIYVDDDVHVRPGQAAQVLQGERD